IALTPVGEAVAARAGAILRAVDELGDLARASTASFGGPLRLGLIPTIAPYLFPAIFAEVARQLPDVELRPREAVTRQLIDELRVGALDAAILALPTATPGLTEWPLFEEEFALARPAAAAHEPPPAPEQLAGMRLLLLEEGHCFRDQALAWCQGAGAAPRDVIEASSLSTLVQMVGAGVGVTLIPRMAIALESRATAVAVTRLPPPAPTRRVGMVWRATSPLAGHLARIAGLVQAAARGLDAPAPLAEAKKARL
ncbi:MAG: hydrogen peroxide-inducible genes activator, partial [Methylobacteriaceae bacterium]|nr:hydrogen peroxide-inducible genes activator [Methylobacteriaceae bacterium]